MSFRLLYTKILTSMTVIIERISWLIKVTDNNDAWWKPEIKINTNLYEPPPQTVMVYTTHIPTTLARLD